MKSSVLQHQYSVLGFYLRMNHTVNFFHFAHLVLIIIYFFIWQSQIYLIITKYYNVIYYCVKMTILFIMFKQLNTGHRVVLLQAASRVLKDSLEKLPLELAKQMVKLASSELTRTKVDLNSFGVKYNRLNLFQVIIFMMLHVHVCVLGGSFKKIIQQLDITTVISESICYHGVLQCTYQHSNLTLT